MSVGEKMFRPSEISTVREIYSDNISYFSYASDQFGEVCFYNSGEWR